MRCLYCGKELALLKRLTGGGEFCSDAHKQSYQEEYNRLALSRLLQAQKKGQQASNPPAQNVEPPSHAAVAVEEPAPEPMAEEAALEAEAGPAVEQVAGEAVEESPSEVAAETEVSVSPEPEPLETAGFLLESPSLAAVPEEEIPYQESWLELPMGPAMSEWQLQNGPALNLSAADLVALNLRPKASAIEDRAPWPELSPQPGAPRGPARPAAGKAQKKANTNRLPSGGATAIDIAPSEVASAADQSFVQAIGFESTVQFDDSELLELGTTGIDFPGEDSDVVVLARSHYSGTDNAATETKSALAEDNSPRASLQALSRLHQELAEQEAKRTEAIEAAPAEVPTAAPLEVVEPPEAVTVTSPEIGPEIVEITAEQTHSPEDALPTPEEGSKPKYATEFFEIPIRTFPPAKPALVGGEAFPSRHAPLLPHLKALPLRPKVALATGYVPPSDAPAAVESKPPAPAAAPTRPPSPSKPAPAGKPSARLAPPKQAAPTAKAAQPAAAKSPEARTAAPAKAVAARPDEPKPIAKPSPALRTPPQEVPAARAKGPEASPKTPPEEKELASKPAPEAEIAKAGANAASPSQEKAAPVADQTKPKGVPTQPKVEPTKKDVVPNFSIAQPASMTWLGSLKVKLGIAILLLLIACVYFLGWGGGKSRPPGSGAVSSDGAGPNIIMGEGGWVEGWGGDPAGMHVGRQITIYRPSLKLSDYRLEFQASIDAKSIGWVFRASDPDNYYAMKLMTVSSGLTPKVALFKYLVVNGKQTQVGRAPVDLAVQPDTLFNIRVDVRGPQFTTYIQGQQVDSWTDDQLKIGGTGFLNEREERGKVKSVSIRYLSAPSK
ncbi:MAG: hypothetical protein ACLPWF_12000 [Bryobacteraceae bacterium]